MAPRIDKEYFAGQVYKQVDFAVTGSLTAYFPYVPSQTFQSPGPVFTERDLAECLMAMCDTEETPVTVLGVHDRAVEYSFASEVAKQVYGSTLQKYGYYSAKAVPVTGIVQYTREDGSTVNVTCVAGKDYTSGWNDQVCVGPVKEFVKRVSDGARDRFTHLFTPLFTPEMFRIWWR